MKICFLYIAVGSIASDNDGTLYLQGGLQDEHNLLFNADFPRRKQYIEENRLQICYPDGYREYGALCTANDLMNIKFDLKISIF